MFCFLIFLIGSCTRTDTQTDRHTDRHTHRHPDTQTLQTDRRDRGLGYPPPRLSPKALVILFSGMLYLITHKYLKMAKQANCKTANAPTRPLWVNKKSMSLFSLNFSFLRFWTTKIVPTIRTLRYFWMNEKI